MDIQIVSDLHLEFISDKPKFSIVKPTAKIIALLGDICCCVSDKDFDTFKRFILEILPLYEVIIFVPGNHEYYYAATKKSPATLLHTIPHVNKKISKWFTQTSPKLHLLANSSMSITRASTTYVIIGATLWTHIPPDKHKVISNSMNDYSYIYEGAATKITPATISKLHSKCFNYIKKCLLMASEKKYRTIVLTHHKPYLNTTHNSNSIDIAYEVDCSSLFSMVNLWAYGHTHISDSKKMGKTLVYSNPKGYPGQRTGYSSSAKVTV